MLHSLFILVFYGVLIIGPPAVAVWFVVSFVRFIKGNKGEQEDYKKRKSQLIISAVLLITLAIPICVLIILSEMAIRNM